MAKVIEEEGGKIHTGQPVREIIIENGKAVGVELENGEKIRGDYVVINADFAYAIDNLVKKNNRKKYTEKKLRKKKYSCSTFMLYIGVDKLYDIPHHNIVFSLNYKKNVDEISDLKILSKDPSFYVQNPSITDDTLAPPGKSTLYVLVPVPNNKSGIDWKKEKEPFKDLVLNLMEQRAGCNDLRQHIEIMKVITPADWEKEENVFLGATFNLAHTVDQMLIFRPHNKFEEFDNCFLVGGGTHPGSGLPTIYYSGMISAKLIMQQEGRKISWH
jgi:phytoene desaturase